MTDQGNQPASDRWYHKGPVLMRGRQVPKSTTDQRLLDDKGHADWLHTDPWRVLRIQAEFVEGFGALAELGPAISVFGSARLKSEHPAYAVGEQVGRALVKEGFAVVTGGGPGAMEAANKGAHEAGGQERRARAGIPPHGRSSRTVSSGPITSPGPAMSAGMMPALDLPGLIRPGQLGPMRRVALPTE